MNDKLSPSSSMLKTAARLVGLLLLVGLFWLAPGSTTAQSSDMLDLIIVVDNSTSMCCPPIENDPDKLRLQFARLFVTMLGVDQSGNDYRLGVVYFGTDAQIAAPLSPIALDYQRVMMQQQLDWTDQKLNMQWTDIEKALRLARDELNRNGRPGAKKAVVLLTDGEPRLSNWPTDNFEQLQDDYIDGLRRYIDDEWGDDIPLFTVAFSQEAFKKDPDNQIYKNLYEELARTTNAPADVGYQEARTTLDLGQIYFNIVRSLLGLETGVELEPPVPVPVVKEFDVNSDLAQVIFVIIKDDPSITTTVTDPSGRVIPCGPGSDSGVVCERSQLEESISITSPEKGTWSVSLNGQGFIQFQAVPFPLDQKYGFRLASPTQPHPAGKPLEIVVNVVERETDAIVSAENVNVKVIYPSKAETAPLALQSVGNDQYAAILEDTRESGDYKLLFTGDVAEGTVHGEGTINVRLVPWVRVEQPTGGGYPANQPVGVVGQLMWVDQPQAQLDASWRLTASANLEGPDGSVRSTKPLEPAADGTFGGQFDAPGAEGEHIVELSLLIETAGGERFTDVTRGRFTVGAAVSPTPPPTDEPTPPPAATPTPPPPPTPAPTPEPREPINPAAVAGGGFGGLLLLGAVGAGIYISRLPKLSGDVNIEGATNTFYSLRGNRPMDIGNGPKSKIQLDGEGIAAKHAEFRPRSKGVDLVPLAGGDGEYAPVQVKGEGETGFHDVSGFHDLRHGDQIKIGDNILFYNNPILGGGIEEYDDGGSGDSTFDFDDD